MRVLKIIKVNNDLTSYQETEHEQQLHGIKQLKKITRRRELYMSKKTVLHPVQSLPYYAPLFSHPNLNLPIQIN